MTNPNIQSSAQERARNFIEGVQAGRTPPNAEPLTPEVRDAVEANIAGLDESNKAKIRLALDALKSTAKPPESHEESLTALFAGTRSDLMQQAPKIANDIMEAELKSWKGPQLTQAQKENIKLAIVDRIASGEFTQIILGGVQGKLKSITDKFSKIDVQKITDLSQIDTIAKEFTSDTTTDSKGESKTLEEKVTAQMLTMMQEGLGDIRTAHESVPQPTGFTALLAHPRALARYEKGKDIPTLLAQSGDAEGSKEAFKAEIQAKIQKLDAQIFGMQATKEKVLDTIARVPEVVSGPLFGLLEWIFKLPIFGKFAAAFLGFSDPKTAIDELKMENRQRKAIHVLVSFGMTKDDKGKVVEGDNRGKIGILKDIDFSTVDFQKLKPFMKKMKESAVDVSASDFWTRVFTESTLEGGEGESKKVLTLPTWESGKESAETIIKKLNAISEAPKKEEKPVQPAEAQKPTQPTPAPGATPTTTEPTPKPVDQKPEPSRPNGPTALAAAGAAATVAAPAERAPVTREQALSDAFMSATAIPFTFTYSGRQEEVTLETGNTLRLKNAKLQVGTQIYELSGIAKSGAKAPITDLRIQTDAVAFEHILGPTVRPKLEIAQGIAGLLSLQNGEKKEIPGKEGGTLIIQRTA